MKKLIILILPIFLLSCQKEKEMSFPFDGVYWSDPSIKDRELVITEHQATQNHYDFDGNLWFSEPFGKIEGERLVQPSISYQVQKTQNGIVLVQIGKQINQLIYYRKQ